MENALIMQKIADSRLKVDSYYTTVSKGQNSKLTATFTSTQTDESDTTEDTTKKNRRCNKKPQMKKRQQLLIRKILHQHIQIK